jgi:hypothetical protein
MPKPAVRAGLDELVLGLSFRHDEVSEIFAAVEHGSCPEKLSTKNHNDTSSNHPGITLEIAYSYYD